MERITNCVCPKCTDEYLEIAIKNDKVLFICWKCTYKGTFKPISK